MATKQEVSDAQDGFAGGWSLLNSVRMGPNQYASALNARLVADGDLTGRQGCRRYLATPLGAPSYITGGFSWRQATGTSDLIVSNGHLYTALANSWGGAAGKYLSLTDRGSGLNPSIGTPTVFTSPRMAFAHFRDGANECVYIADGLASLGGGALPLSKWDGSTFTSHGVGPSGVAIKFIWVYNQRLFGVTGVDQTLYWSALNNGDTLGNVAAGGGFATVRTFGAQALIGGAAVGNTNFLWHNGAISLFRGTTFDDINIAAGALGLAGDVGVCSPFCVVPFDGYAFILTPRGAYLLTATGGLQAFDKPNQPDPTVRDTTFGGGMASFGAYNWMVHNVRYQEVWFGTSGVSSGAGSYPIFVYNYRFGCWVGRSGYALPSTTYITAPWETLDAVRVPQLILGCSDGYPRGVDFPLGTAGETYLDDVLSDGTGGSVFAASAQCRRLWTSSLSDSKSWRDTETTATLNGNSSLVMTATQQGSAPSPAAIQPPSYLVDSKPGAYHIGTGGNSQYLDLAYAWSSSPNLILHKVEASGYSEGKRGVGRPDTGALIDEVAFLRANLAGGDSAMLALYSPGGYPLSVTFASGVASAVADARGNGFGPALTQATLGKRPSWDTGNQILTFDGVTNALASAQTNLFNITTPLSLILVAAFPSAAGANSPAAIAADSSNFLSFRNSGTGTGTLEAQFVGLGSGALNVDSGVRVSATRRLAVISYDGAMGANIDVPNVNRVSGTGSSLTAGTAGFLTIGDYLPAGGVNGPLVLRAAIVLARVVTPADLSILKSWAPAYHGAVLV